MISISCFKTFSFSLMRSSAIYFTARWAFVEETLVKRPSERLSKHDLEALGKRIRFHSALKVDEKA